MKITLIIPPLSKKFASPLNSIYERVVHIAKKLLLVNKTRIDNLRHLRCLNDRLSLSRMLCRNKAITRPPAESRSGSFAAIA